ncbi:hypothetical protein BJ165DRAFT_1303491, partial [Panaeolus papilionaceus]
LPSEILTQIFDSASDEDIIFQSGLSTSLAESAWFKDRLFGEWRLRSPQEAMNMIQRRSGVTKLSIILTCKHWNFLGAQFLYRCLHFSEPTKLLLLSRTLTHSSSRASTITSSHGWWTRRIHVARYTPPPNRSITLEQMEQALVTIIEHCPNLEIFVGERPLGSAFGPVIDTIATSGLKHLRTVHWVVPGESLKKVILAMHSLPHITSAYIDFSTPVDASQEIAHLGATANIPLVMPQLQQLQLRGYMAEFVDQAIEWSLPSLQAFTLDSGTARDDVPDIVGFLENHGIGLVFLDINSEPELPVARILALCVNLQTFCFNVDWRVSGQPVATQHGMASHLVDHPHPNITTIGLHGLLHAFGVGLVGATASLHPHTTRHVRLSNDMNVAALNRANFPRLQRVRVLSRGLLIDLNTANGPSVKEGGYERWARWVGMMQREGVRMEDCTAGRFGSLPMDDEGVGEGEGESDEEEEEEEEWEEEQWEDAGE